MILQPRIKLYIKISIACLIASSIVLYYVASKSYNLLWISNSKPVNDNRDYQITRADISQVIKLSVQNEISFNFMKKHTINKVLTNESAKVFRYGDGNEEIKLAVVLCGERLNQTLITLKSAFIFSKRRLHFIVIVDDNNHELLKRKILDWPMKVLERLSLEIHSISFPKGEEGNEWKKLFKLCACQRLFLPSLLQHIDSLLYVDTDVIFTHPIEDLWNHFYKMNSSQIAALCPEHEDFSTGWYNRFARHPFYEPLGVNSGVMLMNLTRMRTFQWEKYLSPIMKEFKMNIVWGDQDVINIIFHFHPDKLYIFPCAWNFRPDHCMYSSVCKSAKENGIAIIHGNRGVFHNNKQPAFKVIYKAMLQYDLEHNHSNMFLEDIRTSLKETVNTNCGKHLFTIFSTMQDNSTIASS